jgi:hypothetical protein
MSKYNNFQEYIKDNFIHYNGREQDDFESDYDDMLDSCHDEVCISGIKFSPSKILSECDPIAYNCGLSDYIDGLCKDGEWIEEGDNCYFSPEEHQRATDDWDDSNADDDEEDETDFQYRLVREGNLK